MLEDEYDQEKTQERRHMLKGAFLKMKAWYLSAECVDLRAKYGACLSNHGVFHDQSDLQAFFLFVTKTKKHY
jgi:hypothetical protein